MKPSARVASLFIFGFFLFFNGLQVYLIIERIAEAKTKLGTANSSALLFTLSEYHKLKAIDSALTPTHGWIAYSPKKIELSRLDTQSVTFNAPSSSLVTDTVDPAIIEIILNNPTFRSIDLTLFNRLFQKALHAKKVNAAYHLDTITVQGKRLERQRVHAIWNQKKRSEYPYFTSPMRLPYNSNIFIFAQLKNDPVFIRRDLLWPLLAFAAILLIGNTALVFVYRTIRKQKRINELKTDFINNMTHEMKTPITIASAGLEALEHHITPTERTNFYLHTSKKQLHLLNEFVERILDAAVQDISDFNLKKEKIDLHALFGALIQSHSVHQKKPIAFRLTGEGPVYIRGDRLHLETAFHNIIDNAIKYSNGSVAINIDIVGNSRDSTIKIRDNGMGIPPQFINNIFEKFFRVPQGDAQPIKGFGLGLYYVSSIVKKHSGNISVESKRGSGTEFIITLPKIFMIPILLIEDQVELCQILKDTLSIYDFDVSYALNGDDGYRLFTSLHPRLVIIDIMMPGSDGFSAVKQIREVNKDVPIIMLTAKPLTEDLVKAFDLGCNDFIRKPFMMEELIARIRSFAKVSGTAPRAVPNLYKLGSFSFNAATQELANDTNRFQLSYKEVELLKRLCEAKSTVVDRQVLLKESWGSDNVFNSKTMNVYINRLRNYLDSDKSVEILTIRGYGYKLIERSN